MKSLPPSAPQYKDACSAKPRYKPTFLVPHDQNKDDDEDYAAAHCRHDNGLPVASWWCGATARAHKGAATPQWNVSHGWHTDANRGRYTHHNCQPAALFLSCNWLDGGEGVSALACAVTVIGSPESENTMRNGSHGGVRMAAGAMLNEVPPNPHPPPPVQLH